MCGIAGILQRNTQEVDEKILKKMSDLLAHRGPDASGVMVSKNRKVGLSFRRLSIIDIGAEGNQPMRTRCSENWIVFNGEIYNFKELKKNLEAIHVFGSNSDTEVLLHLYEERGEDMLSALDGMFAFAIWDEGRKSFFCARDHMGIKPFYYFLNDQLFVFGSEIKALFAHPDVPRRMNDQSILSYLTFACVPAPQTLFLGISKLEAGECLVVSDKSIRRWRYWTPLENTKTLQEASPMCVKMLLEQAIQKQAVSDVPYGSFLSGGVDSSAISILMSHLRSEPVDVFSVGIKWLDRYNEFSYSRMVASEIGAVPHETMIGEDEFALFLEKLSWHADDPNGDPVCFPLFFLAESAKKAGIKMVQVGEGADELFAGYQSYLNAVRVWDVFWKHARFAPSLFKRLMYAFSLTGISQFLHKHQEVLYRLSHDKELFWGGAVAFTEIMRNSLVTQNLVNRASGFDPYSIIEGHNLYVSKQDSFADVLKRLTYLDYRVRLSELLLMRIDKMTMAHGLEARVPFLDRELVEYAFSLAFTEKIPSMQGKYLLKIALKDVVPQQILDRKTRFWSPDFEWLRKECWNTHLIKVKKSFFCTEHLFQVGFVEKLFNDHLTRRSDNSSALELDIPCLVV